MSAVASIARAVEPHSAQRIPRRRVGEGSDHTPTSQSLAEVPIFRKAACACGGGCPACQAKANDLTISQPNNPAEIEAGQIADTVMRMPVLQRACACGGQCVSCEKKQPFLMREEAIFAGASPGVPDSVGETLREPGLPIDPAVRREFESRFGLSFGDVRIHSGSAAAISARDVDARAYTVGHHIVFSEGEYQPQSAQGRHLLAHELTHVVQQSRGPASTPATGVLKESALEQEAESVAESFESAAPIRQGFSSPVSVARQHRGQTFRHPRVNLIDISCGSMAIVFRSSEGQHRYTLTECDLTDGEYDAGVSRHGSDVTFNLGRAAAQGRRFNFSWSSPPPGEVTPATLLGNQSSVHIYAHQSRLEGEPEGSGSLQEAPVEYVADEVVPISLGAPFASTGLSTFPATFGEVVWPRASIEGGFPSYAPITSAERLAGAGRILSPGFWEPVIPRIGMMEVDRILNSMPESMFTRLETELANRRSGTPLAWTARGFSEAELMSLPGLVRRLNTNGLQVLTPAELNLLTRAAEVHLNGSSVGSPFVSYMRPDFNLTSVGRKAYRIRLEVNPVDLLDVSGPNPLTEAHPTLNNAQEAEFMLTAERSFVPRLIRVTRTGGPPPGFFVRNANALRWGGRILMVAGFALSAHRVASADPRQRRRVAAEEAAGQVFGLAGTALATSGCVALGVATAGVGLFACGLVGGAALGMLASWIAGEAVGDSPTRSGRPATTADLIEFNQAWRYAEQQSGMRCPGNCHQNMEILRNRIPRFDDFPDFNPHPGWLEQDEQELLRRWATGTRVPVASH